MTIVTQAKRKKTGGRTKGTPNKSTREVKALAQDFTQEAITLLAKIMRDNTQPTQARIAAAKEILDRGTRKSPSSNRGRKSRARTDNNHKPGSGTLN